MTEEVKPKILYVDDEQNNLIVFRSSFRRHYDIYTATSASEGLKIIEENDISIIITDQRMPGMTGIEFLKNLPEDLLAIRMILTGFSDVSAIIEAINSGKVYRYITKPWNKDELKVTIDNALEALTLKKNNQELVAELQEINEQLEQKVANRTAELEKAFGEIHEQKKELEELNATKDKFFSIVAHDLRSPVSALAGFSQMLANNGNRLSPEKITAYSKELNKSAKNTLSLIENLLTWASTQMNKLDHNPDLIDAADMINQTLSQLNTVASSKKIALEKELAPDLKIFADKDHLTLVLRNLISNALKFTNEGGKVTVSTKSVDKSKVEISVADTGIGMGIEKLTNLFSVGSAQSTSGTAGEKGTGLGLILCKEFIEKNGGKIEVASLKGMGTTFTITLSQN
ncbi:hybrid sensor histidine kinase/response regulator [Fulvivirga ulvae]|uniref:hybrid sensor histidine kinase/response regulator n=1 Tax=Fulvivirga ulvae TaxID=2904245 RepID=UPI001F2496FE|nr:hybrid sensor histidine kinase/response regulator [Fulvivirga ulvae]UII32485.1 hybrid sensor histidine kinase/response regulator [Fulvivirga ulvae]